LVIASPAIPCSGEKIARRRTPGAAAKRSIARRPWTSTPVWLVTRPTEWPMNVAKFWEATTSSPVRTRPGVAPDTGSGAGVSAGRSAAGASAPVIAGCGGSPAKSAAPTAPAIRRRSSRMSSAPPPFGCTRLVSTIM